MKIIKLAAALCFCSSVVLAETTLEIIQQRAESGDATAQTLMGLMSSYGYKLPRDMDASDEWFQRAADQGDSYAKERVAMAKRRYSSSVGTSTTARKKPSSSVETSTTASQTSSSSSSFSRSKEDLEKKVASASAAQYAGGIDMEKLLLKRANYVGKVIELQFEASTVSTRGNNPYLFIHGKDYSVGHDSLMLCGQEALEWAVSETKRGYGSLSTAYVLVEDKSLVALGTHKRKTDDGYSYGW